ncbi:MAG: VirK family protein [Parachlamydiales bacterium]|nr:VirK family protein [Parachlamydiales bacterium]
MKSLGFVFFLSCSLFGGTIHSYAELASAIEGGKRVTIVSNLQKCSGNPKFPIGSFAPNAMMIVPGAEEKICASDLHFTDYSGQPSYEYVKYTFRTNNSVEIRTTVYSPVDFKQQGTHTVSCAIDQGVDLFFQN